MSTAKAISIQVRPFQATHLCFTTDGVLQDCSAQLGAMVNAVNYIAEVGILANMPKVSGDLSRLAFDAQAIDNTFLQYGLAKLRSESLRVALNKAVNSRQNAYFAKYANSAAVIAKINEFYSPASRDSKPVRLDALADVSNTQWAWLQQAYNSDNRAGVVKNTNSVLNTQTTTDESAKQTGETTQESFGYQTAKPETITPAEAASIAVTGQHSTVDAVVTQDDTTSTHGETTATQTISNTDYGYRVPYKEAEAQWHRSQISLIDQRFSQFMYQQNLPNLAQIFKNELSSIDWDVYKLQVAYLDTILFSPIQGTITGIYKNPGDSIKAGEPVIRVENNAIVLLKAILAFRGVINIGSNITLNTLLFDSTPIQISGAVVAVRGRANEDGQWDTVIKCNNLDTTGKPILPIGYNFDFDDTTVTIS